MFYKQRYSKPPNRVGKPSESLQFKNNLVKKIKNGSYEQIRSIVEGSEETIAFVPHENIKNKKIFKIP